MPAPLATSRVTTQLFNTNGGLTATAIADGTTLSVNGKTITFKTADAPAAASMPAGSGVLGNVATDGNGNSTIYLGNQTNFTNATVGDLLTAIDLANGVKSATIANGVATIATNSGQTASPFGRHHHHPELDRWRSEHHRLDRSVQKPRPDHRQRLRPADADQAAHHQRHHQAIRRVLRSVAYCSRRSAAAAAGGSAYPDAVG